MQPDESSIEISAAERRLALMLAELETGLRRTKAVEQIRGARRTESLRRSAGRPAFDDPSRMYIRTLSVSDRAVALAASMMGLALLAYCWSPLNVDAGKSSLLAIESDAPAPKKVTAARGADASARDSQMATVAAAAPESHAAAAPKEASEGLSVEEFQAQVQRILARSREQANVAGAEPDSFADKPSPNADVASNAIVEAFPEPLTPPDVAQAAPPAPKPEKEAVEKPEAPARPALRETKAKPAPKLAKAARPKVATRQEETPASAPAKNQPAIGRAVYIWDAADALKKLVRSWSL